MCSPCLDPDSSITGDYFPVQIDVYLYCSRSLYAHISRPIDGCRVPPARAKLCLYSRGPCWCSRRHDRMNAAAAAPPLPSPLVMCQYPCFITARVPCINCIWYSTPGITPIPSNLFPKPECRARRVCVRTRSLFVEPVLLRVLLLTKVKYETEKHCSKKERGDS